MQHYVQGRWSTLFFCLKTQHLRGLCHIPASRLLQVPWAVWTPPLNSCYNVDKYDCNFAGELTSRFSSRTKDLKIQRFWTQSYLYGCPELTQAVLCWWPCPCWGNLFEKNPMRHCSPVWRSQQLSFGVLMFFFFKENWHFPIGKHTFVFYHPECFPFKIKTEAKWNIFWQEGVKKAVLADCLHAIFDLTHRIWVSESLLRIPVHHRRLLDRQESEWQTLSIHPGWRQWIEREKQEGMLLGPCSRRRGEQ